MKERRAAPAVSIAVLALCVGEFLFEAWEVESHVDDAYISYRYALNLVEGRGLVYNAGEFVEGFTNLLWTLLVAAGIALGAEAKTVGHALGLVSGVAVLVATYAYARTGLSRSQAWVVAAPVCIVTSSISFTRWSTSGMETPLFVAAVAACLAACARDRIGWATLAASVATLTRPEGVILAVLLFAFHLTEKRGGGLRAWAAPLVYALLLGLVTAFRLAYYGSAVPNTFYAKVPGAPIGFGAVYLLAFLEDGAAFLLPPAAVAVARDRTWRPGAAFVVSFAAYVVYIGGDALGQFRFLLPVLPILAVLAVRGVVIAFEMTRLLGGLAALCIPVAICWQVYGTVPSLEDLRDSKRAAGLDKALRFDRAFERGGERKLGVIRGRDEPVRLVAVTGIGSFGYHSRLPILDLLGLVDPVIARTPWSSEKPSRSLPGHQRSNASYVLSRQPDYILMPKRGTPTLVNAHPELWGHPDFERLYGWDEELRGYRRRARAR